MNRETDKISLDEIYGQLYDEQLKRWKNAECRG